MDTLQLALAAPLIILSIGLIIVHEAWTVSRKAKKPQATRMGIKSKHSVHIGLLVDEDSGQEYEVRIPDFVFQQNPGSVHQMIDIKYYLLDCMDRGWIRPSAWFNVYVNGEIVSSSEI